MTLMKNLAWMFILTSLVACGQSGDGGAPDATEEAESSTSTMMDDAHKMGSDMVDDATQKGSDMMDDATQKGSDMVDDATRQGSDYVDQAKQAADKEMEDKLKSLKD